MNTLILHSYVWCCFSKTETPGLHKWGDRVEMFKSSCFLGAYFAVVGFCSGVKQNEGKWFLLL